MRLLIFGIAVGAVAVGYGLYTLWPTFYHKRLDPKVLRRLSGDKDILLSFDDGPDPRYTGKLLDVLRDNGVKATFFLVMSRADQHPELVARMLREGHSVALHGFAHKSAMVRTPWELKEDFERSMEVIHRRQWPVAFYRPPWGHFNLATMGCVRRHGLRPVTWSVMAQDWEENTTDEIVYRKLLERVRAGDVICLHDAGGADIAPTRTLQALRKALPVFRSRGLHLITADDLLGGVLHAEQKEILG